MKQVKPHTKQEQKRGQDSLFGASGRGRSKRFHPADGILKKVAPAGEKQSSQ